VPAWPLLTQPSPAHRVLDLGRIKADLGYRDAVPARTAVGLTAVWLAEHRPEPGGTEEMVLTDPFDYDAEDRLLQAWRNARSQVDAALGAIQFVRQPGYGLAYSGPGGRARSKETFEP